MKKIYLSMLMVSAGFFTAYAQSNEGGLPLSNQIQTTIQSQQIEVKDYPTPDFSTILKKEIQDEEKGVAKPYMVSTWVASDISLENSGTWSYLENGTKIWRLAISVPESKALSFFYDQFNLPKGVRLFLTNENGKQILGAYTAQNNNEYNNFVNEPVQGDVAILEMDINEGVDISTIQLHINKIGAYYRGVNDLAEYANAEATPAKPTDDMSGTSPCHVNALCPITGIPMERYEKQMNASVRIMAPATGGVGFCSGTLINNTGNTANGTCKPLLITASHCDSQNSHADVDFSQWQFRYNYQYEDCAGPNKATPTVSLNGAYFRARSNYPSFNTGSSGSSSMVADFMLLEPMNKPDANINAYLAGWNRDMTIADNPDYYFYIGYHHPNGDIKKKSWGNGVESNGTFNQNTVPATHWFIPFAGGGTQPGSSGSGLFDINGMIIGDLSGGPSGGSVNCGTTYGTTALYSKLSYGWENEFDQTTFPQFAGAQSQLKDWLDPTNSGVMQLQATKMDCSDVGIKELKGEFEKSINLYPNPSQSGIVNANFNLAAPETIKVTVYNSIGRLVKSFLLPNIQKGSYSFDCSEFSDGIYMMNFSTTDVMVGKKFIIAK